MFHLDVEWACCISKSICQILQFIPVQSWTPLWAAGNENCWSKFVFLKCLYWCDKQQWAIADAFGVRKHTWYNGVGSSSLWMFLFQLQCTKQFCPSCWNKDCVIHYITKYSALRVCLFWFFLSLKAQPTRTSLISFQVLAIQRSHLSISSAYMMWLLASLQ